LVFAIIVYQGYTPGMYKVIVSYFNNLRTVGLLGCFVGLLMVTLGSHALAGDNTPKPAINYITVSQGSQPVHRSQIDKSSGQVFIYTGGFLPAGGRPDVFEYMFDLTEDGHTAGFITPIIFQTSTVEGFTVYTVVGIGKSFAVQLGSARQRLPFSVVEGTKTITNAQCTFGFINASVNSNGVPVESSAGTVDMNDPANGGEGTGGPETTNNWAATESSTAPSPVVTLGTTFGAPGVTADFAFYWPPYRTYSAQAWMTVATP
jgi:hypothetical protein